MPYADWAGALRDLTQTLEELSDGEFLILGERHRDHRWSQLLTRRPTPARYVQVLRAEGVLFAECVGARSLGGTWVMDASTIEMMRTMGWQTPEESRAALGQHTPNFELLVDLSDSEQLAGLLIASLSVLAAHPADLVLEASTPAWAAEG